jgi:hypothetical protein
MATRSDELTEEIAGTRSRMDRTLDEVGRRAGPGRLTQRLRTAVENTRDTVMGTAGDARGTAADTASGLTGAAEDAIDGVRSRGQGNPVAAGLIAFGAGLLAGSIMPESRTEKRLAHEVQRKAQGPVRDSLQRSAAEVGDQVGDRAREAKDRVAEDARHAKDDVAGDARSRADDVRGHAEQAADDVREDAAEQARHHTGR